jgi:hypothetical protein
MDPMTNRDECSPSGERTDEGIIELLKDLREETTLLIRQEVQLAKTEIGEKIAIIARNFAYLAVGGLLAYLGLIVLALAAAAGLFAGLRAMSVSELMSVWLAPLIIGLLIAIVGGILVFKAIRTITKQQPTPKKTVESVKDNARWLKQRAGGATT